MSIQLPTKRKLNLEPALPESADRLNIAARLQVQSNWCWAACIEMATNYKGHIIAQCQAANDALGRLDCCVPGPNNNPANPACNITGANALIVQLCVNDYNYQQTRLVFTTLNIGQIASQISAGHPIFASITWYLGGGHVVLICGWRINDAGVGYVYVNDPAQGARLVTHTSLLAGFALGTWNDSVVDM